MRAKEWVITTIQDKSVPTVEPEPLHYTIESTGTYHLPILKAFGGCPSIVNPLLASPSRRKTDRLDAQLLAYHSITGLWPESFIISDDVQELRVLMNQRNYHIKSSTLIANRLNNIVLRFGHTLGRDGSVTGAINRAAIEDMCNNIIHDDIPGICPAGLPDSIKLLCPDLYKQYDEHRQMAKHYEKLALAKAKAISWETEGGLLIPGDKLLKLLTTVPGIGIITALVWLAEIVTPTRFKTAKQIAAYCGCDPSLKVSAGKVTSYTRRKGNQTLHAMLAKAASTLIQRRSELIGQWGYQIYRRHTKGGWKKACGAVARRLVLGLYYVNLKAVPFSYEYYNFYRAPEVPNLPIEEMGLPSNITTRLKNLGFSTSTQLVKAYYNDLSSQKGVGQKCIQTVREWIEKACY